MTTCRPESLALRCAPAARERGDWLWGTAAPAKRWLLIEHPGPWARLALESPGIAPEQAVELGRGARDSGTRTALVRRHGRDNGVARGPDEARGWWLVDAVGRRQVGGTWSERTGLGAAIAALHRWPEDDEPARPAVLVCTHGVHDACCAIWGRPVAEALSAGAEDVWECSHVGGDRFAANVVVLPEGAGYGRLDAALGVEVVAAHRRRAVVTDHFRGLSTQPPVLQAAHAAVLERYAPAGVDDAVPVGGRSVAVDQWLVTLTGSGPVPAHLVALVHRIRDTPARLTCGAAGLSSPFRYEVELDPVATP